MAAGRRILLTIISLFCVICTVHSSENVIELNEENWTDMLENEWMVEFYAPWCPACKSLQPIWQNFGQWSKTVGFNVGQVDVTKSPGLSGRFMVTALPTIFHVLNGEFRQYKGIRDDISFRSFIKEEKWETIEPIARWKSPNSIQMSIVSSFFKLSQVLRASRQYLYSTFKGIHNQLMEDFGLPTWGSYLIFALATIFLGAILGLILVCVIDFIYPPRRAGVKSQDDKTDKDQSNEKGSGDELADEDIKDDLLDDASASDAEHFSESEKDNEKSAPSSPNVRKRKARKD